MKNLAYKLNYWRVLVLIVSALGIYACDESDDGDEDGNWIRDIPFRGSPRSGAVSFVINDRAYVGLGYNGDDYFTDMYVLDLSEGFWQQVESFPGIPRERAVAFSIDGMGYLGTGFNRDLDVEELADFWQFDPANNTWTQIEDFPGTARHGTVGFTLDGKGYVGTGFDGDNWNNDFYIYDPNTENWREIRSLPGQKREQGFAFTIDGTAYVGGGRNNGLYEFDFWQFDPNTERWTENTLDSDDDDFDDFLAAVRRQDGVAFVLDGLGYVATGINGATLNTVWEYDPTTNRWLEKTSFEGSSRSLAVAFVIQNRAFVSTGQNSSNRFDDNWEFAPFEEYDEND